MNIHNYIIYIIQIFIIHIRIIKKVNYLQNLHYLLFKSSSHFIYDVIRDLTYTAIWTIYILYTITCDINIFIYKVIYDRPKSFNFTYFLYLIFIHKYVHSIIYKIICSVIVHFHLQYYQRCYLRCYLGIHLRIYSQLFVLLESSMTSLKVIPILVVYVHRLIG